MLQTIVNKANLIPSVSAGTEKQLVKPCDLDIYFEAEQPPPKEIPPPSPAFLYENVSAARQRVTGVFSGLLTTHVKISNFFGSLESRIVNVYNSTVADPYFLLTPGVITLATVSGAVVAGRGRRPFKRSLYAIIFGATATSICYPERALDIATTGYYHTTGSVSKLSTLWNERKQTTTERVVKDITDEKATTSEENKEDISESVELSHDQNATNEKDFVVVNKNDVIAAEKASQQQELKVTHYDVIKTDVKASGVVVRETTNNNTSNNITTDDKTDVDNPHVEGDHGQSDPSDKDMYSTRS